MSPHLHLLRVHFCCCCRVQTVLCSCCGTAIFNGSFFWFGSRIIDQARNSGMLILCFVVSAYGHLSVQVSVIMATDTAYKTLDRLDVVYSNESEKFLLQDRSFQRQYAHVYAARLWSLRPKLEQAAKNKWGPDVPIRR